MNSVIAYNAFTKIASDEMQKEFLLTGDALARHNLTVDDSFEKIASVADLLPEMEAIDLWTDACVSYVQKYASAIADQIRPYAASWTKGYREKCASIGADPDKLMEKQAGMWDMAKGVADIGSYFIPGVGTARMGYDAFKDFKGMFGKGLNWKQRLGKGLSGLMNTGFAALSVIPGLGALGGAAGKVGKFLSKAPKASKLVGIGKKLTGAGSKLTGWGSQLAGKMAGKGGKLGSFFFNQQGLQNAAKGTGGSLKNIATGKGGLALGAMGMGGGLLGMGSPAQAAAGVAPQMGQHMMNNPMPYLGTQGGAPSFRGSNFGGGVQPMSRFSAGGRW